MSISVTIVDARKSFGQTHALRGVSLNIATGSVHALLGPNGSGKSTLIRILAGIEQPGGGEIAIGGAVQRGLTPMRAPALGIELAPQEPSLVPGWSLVNHLSLPRLAIWSRLGFIDTRREREAASAALTRLQVVADPEHELADLSGGNQQRALMSRWLMCGSEVLLIDEPCAGVDIVARMYLIAAIRNYVETKSVIVASSDPGDLVETCDRVLCLRKGEVVQELTGDEITEEAIVRPIMTSDKNEAHAA